LLSAIPRKDAATLLGTPGHDQDAYTLKHLEGQPPLDGLAAALDLAQLAMNGAVAVPSA
jgi:hypothetical protein